MPDSKDRYRGLAILALCAGAFAVAAPAAASTGVSEECATARDHVEAARDAVKDARHRLRRAKRHGDRSDVRKARRGLERKEDNLTARKNAVDAACAAPPPTGPYVALGDSIAGYASQLFPYYQATLGATELLNRSRGGESSSSIRTSGQLATALADIDSPSDTSVVTINIGGVDALAGCQWTEPSCHFRANFDATLDDLVAALAGDPGDEPLVAMAYHNPASGRGDSEEARIEMVALGSDGVRNCSGTGAQLGLNDVISQEAAAHGALLADAYPAIMEGGQAYMQDSLHPNGAGYAAIAEAFKAAGPPCG